MSTERLPDTPAGRQAAWFIHQSTVGASDLKVDEIAQHMRLQEPWTPEEGIDRFVADGPMRVISAEEVSSYELAVRLVYEREPAKPWLATIRVAKQTPHVITRLQLFRDVGEGVVIREAREADAPVLAGLERRSPLTVGAASITYDRGEDFFAFARLMEETTNLVAEEEGRIVALHCVALHPAEIGGKEYQAMLLHHTRIPPEHQKKGLFSPLNMRGFQTYEGRMEAAYANVAVENTDANRLGGPDSWSFPALRALLLCERLGGIPAGRPAGPDDAPRIVEILNSCHKGEEMYLPYTVQSLTARLARAPELYSWEQVWMTDRAVVGVWPAGLSVVREENGLRASTVRATVLDHGFVAGAEDEFERLLRAWCGWLFEHGSTELAVFTSEGSPNDAVLSRLADRIDAFDFRMGAPEPAGAAQRGLYVDPIYF